MNIQTQKEAFEILIPGGPCIYYLTDEVGDILYIGKTKKSIIGRIAQHQYEKQFSRVFYKKCRGFKEMDELELELIAKLRPKYNQIILRPKSKDHMLTLKEVKQRINVDGRIIKVAADFYNIGRVMIGSTQNYEPEIVEATMKYIGSLKKCPLSIRDYSLWEKCRKLVNK